MDVVSNIFAALDAADVRLWRDGDALRFTTRPGHGLPDALARDLRTHKPALLACIPNNYGWHHGAIFAPRIDLRAMCLNRAHKLGFPRVRVETLDDCVVVVEANEAAWRTFTARQVDDVVACGFLALDDYAATRKERAA